MKYLLMILIPLMLFSCKEKKVQTRLEVDEIALTSNENGLLVSEEASDDENSLSIEEAIFEPYFELHDVGVKVLIDGYTVDVRTMESPAEDGITPILEYMNMNNWYCLSYLSAERKFSVHKVALDTTIHYWECGAFDVVSMHSNNKRGESILLINGIENLEEGKIDSHFHRQVAINTDKPYNFVYGGIAYQLRAEGIKLDANEEEEMGTDGRWQNGVVYKNYKLYLASAGNEQLLVAISEFSDRFVAIEFIGDLDGDTKPDFVFETSTWYEDFEKTLFLSSKADKGKLVKCVGVNGFSMAC